GSILTPLRRRLAAGFLALLCAFFVAFFLAATSVGLTRQGAVSNTLGGAQILAAEGMAGARKLEQAPQPAAPEDGHHGCGAHSALAGGHAQRERILDRTVGRTHHRPALTGHLEQGIPFGQGMTELLG